MSLYTITWEEEPNEYRIVELLKGIYVIERKKIYKQTQKKQKGFFGKVKYETQKEEWIMASNIGEYHSYRLLTGKAVYETLEEAKEAKEYFEKYPIVVG